MTSLTAKRLPSSTSCPKGRYSNSSSSSSPVDGGEDVSGRDTPFLNRRLGGGRGQLPSSLEDSRGITYRPHPGAASHPQALIDYHPVALCEREVEILELGVRADAGRPHYVLGPYLPPVIELHAVGHYSRGAHAGDHLDAPSRQLHRGCSP